MLKTALIVFLAMNFAWLLPAAARGPSVYTVAKVSVSADAQDAVAAKEKALAQAQQDAFRQLMKRMTHYNMYSRFPVLEDALIERMVDGFAVRRESNSNTRYIATLDFTFEPTAVRDILNRFNLPFTDQQAPQVLMLPVMVEAGAIKSTDNPWFVALEGIDGENGLTPIKLAPPRQDISPSMVNDLANHSQGLFETLKYQYRAEKLVLAVAEVDGLATQLNLRLVGHDAVGNFSWQRSFRIYGRDTAYAADMAAKVALKVIEGRWKTVRLESQGALSAEPATIETLSITAQFSGLKEWQEMRRRLQQVPGLQTLDVKSLNARGADLSVDFSGGAERLAKAAQSQGLALEDRGGSLVLVTR